MLRGMEESPVRGAWAAARSIGGSFSRLNGDVFVNLRFRMGEAAMMARATLHRIVALAVIGAAIGLPSNAAQGRDQDGLVPMHARTPQVTTTDAARLSAPTLPEDAHWIWSPAHRHRAVPKGSCYFRKTFRIRGPGEGQVLITADDRYELFVNGHHLGAGHSWQTLDAYDISKYLVAGRNVVAVEVVNEHPGTAALVARIVVKPTGSTYVAYPSDTSWRTSLKVAPSWNQRASSDDQWIPAQSFGLLGQTLPWAKNVHVAGEYGRFRTRSGFDVEWIVTPEQTGSLIAMTFDGAGRIIASREGGPLLRIVDGDGDGVLDTVTTYCDQVKNCQGLLAVDGAVIVVGDGPRGSGVHRLIDTDRDGKVDRVEQILHFQGTLKEHGPHAIRLGPDGLLYIMVGNHASLAAPAASSSPYRDAYEGDLVRPRYEDPGGHAAGIQAPGGMVVRTDRKGSHVEIVAGGLRNPYDLAFNRQGELFTYDADMEWDRGTPWYRPTRVNHVIPGAEFGWRSGWAKWPSYFIDSLPATRNMGVGSPTGLEFYDHVMYPMRYHDALFAGDWSLGRIYAIRFERHGASYRATSEVFVEGRPLNITDLEVGPDGWLYFCTGGRGTGGGIYRVVWNGRVPPEATELGAGIDRALHQPQPSSRWGRQRIAEVRRALGDRWEPQLIHVARDTARKRDQRVRALDLLASVGPPPSSALLIELTNDADALVRAKAVFLLGLAKGPAVADRLVTLLKDRDAAVRRIACESLVRGGHQPPAASLLPVLADGDRQVAFAARRCLETVPPKQWRETALTHRDVRIFVQGATALMVAHPDKETAIDIINRCLGILQGQVKEPGSPKGFLSDRNFTDIMRVLQLALLRGPVSGREVPELRAQLSREYPSKDAIMNRELVRLLVYLQEPSVTSRMIAQLSSDLPMPEKLQVGMFAPQLRKGWTTQDKLALFRFYEQARTAKGGKSLGRYIDRASRRLAEQLTETERRQVLAEGTQWPTAALSVLMKLPEHPGRATLRRIRLLDQQLAGVDSEAAERLRLGNVAVLGRSGEAAAMAYLRQLYARDPARRTAVVMGLAQHPDGENWELLVKALPVVDGVAAGEVLARLAEVDRRPADPEAFRQVILCGLRARKLGAPQANRLLERWTGQQVRAEGEPWEKGLAKWQAWFAETYPNLPAATLPKDSDASKWTFAELMSFLDSPQGSQGDPRRGAVAFRQAQCAKCHRYGDVGERIGPDLSTVSRRFQRKEILESILFPSQVISDQYSSRTVVSTDGRVRTGIAARLDASTIILLMADGTKMEMGVDQIEQIRPAKTSIMPEGLLNTLSLDQVADLFAFLGEPPRTDVTSRRPPRPKR